MQSSPVVFQFHSLNQKEIIPLLSYEMACLVVLSVWILLIVRLKCLYSRWQFYAAKSQGMSTFHTTVKSKNSKTVMRSGSTGKAPGDDER